VWRDELVVPMWEDVRCITPDGEIRVIYTPPGAVRVSEAATSRQDPNRLWLATTTGLRSLYFDAGVWRDEGPLAETKGTLSYLIEDTDGSLWGSGPGLGFVHVRFAGPTHGPAHPAVRDVHSFVEGSGLPTQVVVGSPRLWDDEMLFTISGANALLRFDREREQFAPVVGVRTIEQPMMLTVGAGRPDHLWMAVDRLEPQQWRIYRSSRDGELRALPQTVNQPLGAAYVFLEEPGPDGDVLWVGGNESIMRVELSRAFVRPSPLVVQLRATEFSPNAQRRPAQRDAEFEYFAPRYQKGAAVSYQTRLAGYEANWSAWSGTRRRGFTNLPPGRYEFMVRAHDTDGVESAPTSISFTILPPWWKTWWFVGLASLSGIGGVAGVTRWFANRALKRRVALLEAQSAVERERLRLARDLHDEVGSGLGRVILFAGEARRNKADPARLETSLDRVRDAAQALVSHAREIVWAVSPQHDALASVIERLGDYTDETLRAAGIACAVQSPSPDKIPPVTLGSEARHSLFLAVKEAVHNCVKYSEAKSAELTLAITGADFVITLRDHGRGFAPGERRGSGHGTKNIIARAEALGGDGEITSEPGKGTVVRLRVPLQQT
jgi:signal transduction histidine kinase